MVWLNKKRPKKTPVKNATPEPQDKLNKKEVGPMIASSDGAPDKQADNAPATSNKKQTSNDKAGNDPGSDLSKKNQAESIMTELAKTKISADSIGGEPPVVITSSVVNEKELEQPPISAKAKINKTKTTDPSRKAEMTVFSTPSENASRVRANTQPAAFDNPLPKVPQEDSMNLAPPSNTLHTVTDGQTFIAFQELMV